MYSRIYSSLRIINLLVSSTVKLNVITKFICYSCFFDCTCGENSVLVCLPIYLPIVIFRENSEYEKSDLLKGNENRSPLARKIEVRKDREGKDREGNSCILLTSLS